MGEGTFDILFEPLEMPNLKVKNRFFMAPMGTTFAMDRLTDYMVVRAKADVELITTGEISVHPSGRAFGGPIETDKELRLECDDDIKIVKPLVDAVHAAGSVIIAQLNHTGRYSFQRRFNGRQAVAPSPIASRYTGETPRELTTVEVDELVTAFADAAVRARKAGFDGIELCGCSGYLISQFLSGVTNKRQDRYGGNDIIQRGEFLFKVLSEIRKLVGTDYNISVKIDAEDGVKGGKILKDSLRLAPRIVQAGADRLHIWAGWHEATRPMLPMFVPRGAFVHLAKAIKEVVDVPVATVGRINDPLVAANILRNQEADLIGLGRALLCDPKFVRKTMTGRADEIRKCIGCCYCFDRLSYCIRGDSDTGLKCAINPELGQEGEKLIKLAEKEKKVVVVGAGPAGMEVARVAALRGHHVTLFEKGERLGGMVHIAAIPPHKEELKNIIDYYSSQMKKLAVDVRYGTVCTSETIEKMNGDVVILATGAVPIVPDIPGIRRENVALVTDVLTGKRGTGGTIVVIGGGLIGMETAEYCADQGKYVTVIEMLDTVANDIGPTTRWGFLSRIREKITVQTSTKAIEIRNKSVNAVNRMGEVVGIPAETVIIAIGLQSNRSLTERENESKATWYTIGSCHNPGTIAEAIAEAFAVGCSL